MTQTKAQQPNPQIFTIWSDEIEGRIDPCFYKSEFKELNKILAGIKTVKFSELINSISMGASIPEYKEEKNEAPFVFGKNVKHGFLDLNNLEYISQKTCQKFKSSILEESDLVFSVRGVYIGKVAKIPKELKGGNIINNLVRINLKDKTLADYLTIYLSSKTGQALINREVWGGAQPGITNEQIKNLQIPLPPIQIQNKIVSIMSKAYEEKKGKEIKAGEILNSVDDFVLKELKIKMPEIKKEMVFEVWSDKMKSRIDSEYYQKFYKTFFGEIEKSKFPKEPLGNITEFVVNGRTPAKEDYVDSGNGVPIIKAGTASGKMVNLKKLGYVKNNFQGKQTAKKGDIFILSAAHQAEYVGKNVSLLDQELKQDTYFVGELVGIRVNQEKCLSRYLFSFLSTQFIFILMNREKRGQTSHLYPADLKNLPIPIPPLNIQKKIAEKTELYYFQAKTLKKEAKEVLENAKEKVEEMILK